MISSESTVPSLSRITSAPHFSAIFRVSSSYPDSPGKVKPPFPILSSSSYSCLFFIPVISSLLFSSTISVLLQQFLFQTQSDHTFQLLCLRQQHLISCRIRNVLVDLRFLRNIDLSHRLPCAETIRHALCQISVGSFRMTFAFLPDLLCHISCHLISTEVIGMGIVPGEKDGFGIL